jgi:CubicO group peptidase (beta-lactamase class C family)
MGVSGGGRSGYRPSRTNGVGFGLPILAALLLAGCGATGSPSTAQARPDAREPVPPVLDPRFEEVRERLGRMVAEEAVPSVAVAVAKNGVILWEEGFGRADRERGIPASAHTPYSIASINKAITSTAVMILSERGMLDLDAPIERYLGGIRLTGLAGDTRDVTARRAMAHSAGLPLHFRIFYAGDDVPAPEETLGRYGVVVFPPGMHVQYSNIGYRALDVAIGNVSGMTYGEFLDREIFAPLGMTNSVLDLDDAWGGRLATRYTGAGDPIGLYVSDHPGSGDVWASAHDLVRFAMAHLGTLLPGQRPVLGPDAIAEMQRNAAAPGFVGGLSWALGADRGHRVVEHGGGQPGVSTQLSLYPDHHIAIAVVSNQSGGEPFQIARQIAAVLLPEPGVALAPEPAPRADTRTPAALTDLAGRWDGTLTTYEGDEPFVLEIADSGEGRARIGGGLTSLVNNVSLSDGVLRGVFHGIKNTGDARAHPHVLSLTLRASDGLLAGQLSVFVDEPARGLSSFVRLERPDTARLEEYVGVYRHGEDDRRTIGRDGDRLYSRRGGGPRYELDPAGEDTFVMVGTGGSRLRFERGPAGVNAVEWVGTSGARDRARRVD